MLYPTDTAFVSLAGKDFIHTSTRLVVAVPPRVALVLSGGGLARLSVAGTAGANYQLDVSDDFKVLDAVDHGCQRRKLSIVPNWGRAFGCS